MENECVEQKTAIGYTRLSQRSDTSLQNQEDHIREYAREHDLELVEIRSDGERASGFDSDERPAYGDVVERVRAGDVDAVVTNDKRRLTRDVDEAMRLIPDFRQSGVELHTWQDGQLDLDDPIRAAIEIVSAAVAFEEKRAEIEKAMAETDRRLEDDDTYHGAPPYGLEFSDDGESLVPSDEWGDVELIFEMRGRNADITLAEIAEHVDPHYSTVHRILDRRDFYEEWVDADFSVIAD